MSSKQAKTETNNTSCSPFQGSTKCNARVVTNVVEGVHKIVLECKKVGLVQAAR